MNAGLAGAIVIDGAIDAVPGVAGLPERLFVLQGPETRDGATVYTVNGVANPEVAIRPGQTQRWRLANTSANAYFNLQLEGHQFHVIANDGNALPETRSVDTLLLAPGQRADALVQATEPGRFQLRSLAWGAGGQAQPEFPVAALVAGGAPMEPRPLPTTLLPVEDLAAAGIAEQRIIDFQMNATAPVFTIDGLAFDHHVVNTTVKLNTVEEWILRNTSDEWRPFHIHVNDVQVMSVDGEPRPLLWRDTVNLPPHGQVVVRIPFRDFAGKFVYRCRILAHEDFGMMAVVEVVP